MFTVSSNMFHDVWPYVHDGQPYCLWFLSICFMIFGHIVLLPVHVVMISVHIALFPGCTWWLCQVRRFMFFCRLILCFAFFEFIPYVSWSLAICFAFWPNRLMISGQMFHNIYPYLFMMSDHTLHGSLPYVSWCLAMPYIIMISGHMLQGWKRNT